MIAAIVLIAIASFTGANAAFCNQLVNQGGIVVNPNPTSISNLVVKNTTIMNYTVVSNYSVCYSITVGISLSYAGLSGSVEVWDMGGFPYVNATGSTQLTTATNITNITQCQSGISQSSFSALCNLIKAEMPSGIVVSGCNGLGVCCVENNCNKVVYFNSASTLTISMALLVVFSLIASFTTF